MNLLIVDDENVIREGLLSLDWRKLGIKYVYSATNGYEAKRTIKSNSIDIMISDISMPGVSGLDLSKYIYKSGKDTVSILLTGYSDFNYAQEAIRNQVFEYLLKPIRPDELFATTNRAIQKLYQTRQKNEALVHYEKVNDLSIVEKTLFMLDSNNPTVVSILTKISKEYSEDIALNEIAEEYHFTPIYLSRLIKRETGYTFVNILLAIRLTQAVNLLKDNEKIFYVSEKCGFKDQRYFSQVFKRIFDCTPSDYRSNNNKVEFETLLDLLEHINLKKI